MQLCQCEISLNHFKEHNIDINSFTSCLCHIIEQMPGFVAWKTVNSTYAFSNKLCATLAGYKDIGSYIGKSDYDWKCDAVEYADKIIEQDKFVLQTKKHWNSLNILKFSGAVTYYKSHKSILYSPQKEVIGILFVGTILNDAKVLNLFKCITHSDMKKSSKKSQYDIYNIINNENNLSLSKRQEECMFYLLRGNTSKIIANKLAISNRTVESHLEELKIKFNCMTKPELIEKAIELGYFYRVPASLLEKGITRGIL